MKLVQAQIFIRHGARTPLHHILLKNVPEAQWTPDYVRDHERVCVDIETNDLTSLNPIPTQHYEDLTNRQKLPGGSIIGMLTYMGQQQLLDLGKLLRDTYGDKLFSTLDPNSLYCRSTGFARTVRSAQSCLTTLFNEDKLLIKNCRIFVQHPGQDFLALTLDNNKHFCSLHEAGIKSCNEDYPEITELKCKIKQILGMKKIVDEVRARNPFYDEPVYVVRDDFVARKFHGFQTPSQLDEISEEIDRISTLELNIEYTGPKKFWQKNIAYPTGPIIHEILFNMQNYNKLKRFRLYFAHDSTLMPLLLSLNAKEGVWPPYAAYITLELYSTDDNETFDITSKGYIGPIDSQYEKIKGNWSQKSIEEMWFKIKFMEEELSLEQVMGNSCHKSDKKLYPLKKLIEIWEPIAKSKQEYIDMIPEGMDSGYV